MLLAFETNPAGSTDESGSKHSTQEEAADGAHNTQDIAIAQNSKNSNSNNSDSDESGYNNQMKPRWFDYDFLVDNFKYFERLVQKPSFDEKLTIDIRSADEAKPLLFNLSDLKILESTMRHNVIPLFLNLPLDKLQSLIVCEQYFEGNIINVDLLVEYFRNNYCQDFHKLVRDEWMAKSKQYPVIIAALDKMNTEYNQEATRQYDECKRKM